MKLLCCVLYISIYKRCISRRRFQVIRDTKLKYSFVSYFLCNCIICILVHRERETQRSKDAKQIIKRLYSCDFICIQMFICNTLCKYVSKSYVWKADNHALVFCCLLSMSSNGIRLTKSLVKVCIVFFYFGKKHHSRH